MDKIKTYIFHWLDGKNEKLQGISASNAFNKAGYGAGALAALDYYEEIKEDTPNG